jgi:RNA polymerase sporulation-specific sigma factor
MKDNYYRILTDDELFSIIKNDKNAENEFYKRYKNRVRNILRRYKIYSFEREDLIQEGMIGLFQAIENYDKKRGVKFSTYANVCIKNRIINALNLSWQHRKNIDEDQDIEEIVSVNNPENYTIDTEYSELMKNGVKSLNETEQKVLAKYLENKSYKTIASELEISTKKVDNILVKIRMKLTAYIKGVSAEK